MRKELRCEKVEFLGITSIERVDRWGTGRMPMCRKKGHA
jgi:hypothetical protein